jgi:putative DNA modification/repair radical SAM protein
MEKLAVLADSAKYDASCSSSGTSDKRTGKIGNAMRSGCCHSWAADGRCISLLKILQSNDCIYECSYCVNRFSNDIKRATFSAEELAQLTIDFYKRNYIEGLFLSSAVLRSPDFTMELMIKTMKLLRDEYGFAGYIHCKLIPGANQELIDKAGRLADRVSVNIELPSRKSLALLAPQKKHEQILSPMQRISDSIKALSLQRRKIKTTPSFAPAGQSTQLIIGATPESDLQIMRLSSWLYKKMSLKRVYYSAYVPVNNTANLPALYAPPLLREHRLYQADWLIRFYGFDISEILDEQNPRLDEAVDPKVFWAFRHIEHFPIEINKADYETLLRIPGIGIRSAKRIVCLRRVKKVQLDDMKKLRVVLKRARYFITVNGKYYGDVAIDPERIKQRLVNPLKIKTPEEKQLSFFDPHPDFNTFISAVTGEF